jgi:hypothetical protein
MPDDATPTEDPAAEAIAIPEVPEDLGTLDDDAVRALYESLETARVAQAEAGRALTGFAAIDDSRRRVGEIVAHQNRLATEQLGRQEAREGLNATATPLPEAPAEPEPIVTAPAVEVVEPAPDASPELVAAVTAAIGGDALNGEPAAPPPNTEPARPRAAMVASAGQTEQGQELDFAAIGQMVQRNRTGPFAKVELVHVAGFGDMPELRETVVSNDNHVSRNDALIREATVAWREQFDARTAEPRAMRAAICDPLDNIRDIPDCVTAAEPFADSLPSRPAGRLGFQFTPAMSLSEIEDGVSTWGEDDQASVDPTDPDTWKSCVVVDCPTPESVIAKAIVGCFSFDNTTDMSNPERIRDAISKVNAQRARRKEAHLLRLYDESSHHYNATLVYGALDGFIHALLTTLAQGSYPERLDGAPYLAWLPPGLLEALVIDRDHQREKSDFERGEITGYIEGELAAGGHTVRLVNLLDVNTGSSAPFPALNAVGTGSVTALPQLGGDVRPFKVRLGAPETLLYFSTGSIEMGIERSPELNRQNRAQWFAEEYVGLAKHGCYPNYTLNLVACPTGSRAAASSVFACPSEES